LSLIAPYYQRFWNAVCARLPAWLAPNCVTVAGLLLAVVSAALCWRQSPRFDTPLSPALLLLHAALLFGYQTLDAVDGKQARRTGSSGPLGAPGGGGGGGWRALAQLTFAPRGCAGELCDHTCDALVCTLLTLTLSSTLLAGSGGGTTVLLLWLVGTAPFCLCTWRMLNTGKMTLPAINGPNEGMAILYCTCAATAMCGQSRRVPTPPPPAATRAACGADARLAARQPVGWTLVAAASRRGEAA
jgi:ethanolaminephosphotransferase